MSGPGGVPGDRAFAWLTSRENLLFLTLILLHLIPIWAFKYFPSQDGPSHLENASILRECLRGSGGILQQYYLVNWDPLPNWYGHVVLAGFMSFAPALVAEKILLSGYVILFPVSIRYALRAIQPESGDLSILIFPLVYNYPLHMGFYNFSYGLPFLLFFVAYWLKSGTKVSARGIVFLALMSSLLYFSHIVAFVQAYVAIGVLTGWLLLLELVPAVREGRGAFRPVREIVMTRVVPLVLASLPALILVVLFLHRHGGMGGSERLGWWRLWRDLLALGSLISYDMKEVVLSIAFVGLLASLFLVAVTARLRDRRLRLADGLLCVCFTYVLIYFLTPNELLGGTIVSARFGLYPYLAIILWVGTQSYRGSVKRAARLGAIFVAVTFLGLRATKYAEINDYLEEYVSASKFVTSQATLLPVSLSDRGQTPNGHPVSVRVRPFLHASGYIAASMEIVELANYEGWQDHFPTQYRPDVNPLVDLFDGDPRGGPLDAKILRYNERTGGQVDYVLIWGAGQDPASAEEAEGIVAQLEEGYELIYTSPKRGLLELYLRKETPHDASSRAGGGDER